MKKITDLISEKKLDELIQHLLNNIKKLARAVADFGFLASNTPHIVFDDLKQILQMPLISIIETAYETCKNLEIIKVGLLGMQITMQGHFYPDLFYRNGISLVVPNPQEQDYIHEKIYERAGQ